MCATSKFNLIVLSVILGGCASPKVGPDYHAPDLHLPAHWSAKSQSPDLPASENARLERWWTQLEDENLNWLIDQALTGNLDLKLAQARLHQARASRQLAEAGLFPQGISIGRGKSNELLQLLQRDRTSIGSVRSTTPASTRLGRSMSSAATAAVWKQPRLISRPAKPAWTTLAFPSLPSLLETMSSFVPTNAV